VERVLAGQALSRARFPEKLAAQGSLPAQGESLFTLGPFSPLDRIMGQPMHERHTGAAADPPRDS
jgi:hypothetical protein